MWLSVDPIINTYLDGIHNGGVYNPKNLSFYGYTYQNPVAYTDPTGEQVKVTTQNVEQNMSVNHKINVGENLSVIAKNLNTTVEALIKLNPQIKDKNRIYAGHNLVIGNKSFIGQQQFMSNREPTLIEQWSGSDNLFFAATYSLADGLVHGARTYFAFFTFGTDVKHLDGTIASKSENLSSFASLPLSFIPNPAGKFNVGKFKTFNIGQFNKEFSIQLKGLSISARTNALKKN